mmetsp:Transcript_20079/g.39792  ORF Transcript_20079/g.39792 Transcript_20079/m.39792 type:complete len:203 (+) Transcript_20079:123-731(+)
MRLMPASTVMARAVSSFKAGSSSTYFSNSALWDSCSCSNRAPGSSPPSASSSSVPASEEVGYRRTEAGEDTGAAGEGGASVEPGEGQEMSSWKLSGTITIRLMVRCRPTLLQGGFSKISEKIRATAKLSLSTCRRTAGADSKSTTSTSTSLRAMWNCCNNRSNCCCSACCACCVCWVGRGGEATPSTSIRRHSHRLLLCSAR